VISGNGAGGDQNNLIGGTVAGAGNTVAFNGAAGVAIFGNPMDPFQDTGNAILGNSIFNNSGLGIDLTTKTAYPNDDGVTLNTLGGPHAGPNNLQNFPVLVSAAVNPTGTVTIRGSLDSTPNTTFRIEFFSSQQADPTGYGQGRAFLGFTNVSTDSIGNGTFTTTLASDRDLRFLTATATDASNNTSEFSQATRILGNLFPNGILARAQETGQWWVAKSTGSSFQNQFWTAWNPNVTWDFDSTGSFDHSALLGYQPELIGHVKESGQWWVSLPNGASQLWTTWSTAVTWVDFQTGDFNGDHKTDIAARVAETGQWWVGLSTGTSFVNQLWATWSTAVTWVDVTTTLVTYNGLFDIVGRASELGQWWVAASTGSSFTNQLWATWSTAVTWVDVQWGNLTGGPLFDVIGRAKESGQWWAGLSDGSRLVTHYWTTWSTAVTWVGVGLGDFNGDGKDDISGFALELGQWWVSVSNGSGATNQLWTTWSTGVNWAMVGWGDFNNDGRFDVVGLVADTGQWWVGLSNGSQFINQFWGTWSTSVSWVDYFGETF
jgi:hypothetical protein